MTDRGVSTVVSYALILGIVALLTTGLLFSMSGFVDGQQRDTTHSTFEVVGNTLAGDVAVADRLVTASEQPQTVSVTSTLPDRVAGSSYVIDVEDTGDGSAVLTLRGGAGTGDGGDVFTTVTVRTETPVESTTVEGGAVEVRYDSANETLVVHPDESGVIP